MAVVRVAPACPGCTLRAETHPGDCELLGGMLRHQARYEHLLAKPLGHPSLFTFEPMDTISPSPSRFEWISERLNPVLIKEVRQALRGASFRNVYLVTLILIGVVGTTVLLNLGISNDAGGGRIYGTAVVGCLCVGVPAKATHPIVEIVDGN